MSSRTASTTVRGAGAALAAALTATLLAVTLPAGAAVSIAKGADVASYQHPGGAGIRWDAYARGGHSFVFIKATEGINYANPYFGADWTGSAVAGLQHAAYHYARPSLPLSSAGRQARFFTATVRMTRQPGQLPPVLDLEDSGGLTPRQLIAWTSRWLAAVQRLTGYVPMIYSYPYFWRTAMADTHAFTRYPLWIASYGHAKPDLFGGWSRYTFWQYDAYATAPGINGSGSTDLNKFNGTVTDLQRLGGGAVSRVHPRLRDYWVSSGALRTIGPATAPAARVGSGLGQNFFRSMAFITSSGTRVIAGPIRDRYLAVAGTTTLGLPTGAVTGIRGVAGAQVATFQTGRIYASPSTGAHALLGPTLTRYQAIGGPSGLGLPTADAAPVPGIIGAQVTTFTGGRIYWAAGTGPAVLRGSVLARYLAAGASGLGLPTADTASIAGAAQVGTFQNGRIYSSPRTGARIVSGPILDHYLAVGGPTALGLPTGEVTPIAASPGAAAQSFAAGRIFDSPSTGAFALSGAVLSRYLRADGMRTLGLPTSDVTAVPGVVGAQTATFQNGRIYSSPRTGARVVTGAVLDHYLAVGGPSALGLPTGEVAAVAASPGAAAQLFAGGRIFTSPATGTFALSGPLLSRYLHGAARTLGLPTSDLVNVPGLSGGQMATFQNGRIYWSPRTGARTVVEPVVDHYLSLGGPTVLGLPTSEVTPVAGNANALAQTFTGGRIFASPTTGAHALTGQALERSSRPGALRRLGLPTSDAVTVPSAPAAQVVLFQRGRIYMSRATGPLLLDGPILRRYLSAGGPARLGLPVTEVSAAGRRGAQKVIFERSRIYWSRATGAHEVLGAILAAYLRAGGAAGKLGLPTDAEHAAPGGRAQHFTGGLITWRRGTGAKVTLRH